MSSIKDILAVDDEPVVLTAISKTCTSERLKVDCAESAAEALKRMESQDYRLIISDIKMPEMDGFQLLGEIKKRGIMSGVIISTGYATVENAVHALTEGAIDFIPKPFTADELLSAVYR
ncbi:MAG TPA: response regulator, partial [bacterium]|nr:response regulator [bacterium]